RRRAPPADRSAQCRRARRQSIPCSSLDWVQVAVAPARRRLSRWPRLVAARRRKPIHQSCQLGHPGTGESERAGAPAETDSGDPMNESTGRGPAPPEPDADAPPEPLAPRAPVRPDSPAFADFAIRPDIVAALAAAGIVRTFAIQEMSLPIALAGSDLIGQARTGTGKTLGFGVPLLNRLDLPSPPGASPQALVITPTRELAIQVSGDLATAGAGLGARVATIYGGRAYEPQIQALDRGVDVVVGTPGRLLDLVEQHHLALAGVRILVLDEADEMLDLGFLPDIEKLLTMLPARRQTMLF